MDENEYLKRLYDLQVDTARKAWKDTSFTLSQLRDKKLSLEDRMWRALERYCAKAEKEIAR